MIVPHGHCPSSPGVEVRVNVGGACSMNRRPYIFSSIFSIHLTGACISQEPHDGCGLADLRDWQCSK